MKARILRRRVYVGGRRPFRWQYLIAVDGDTARNHWLSDSLRETRLACLKAPTKLVGIAGDVKLMGLGCESVCEDWSGRTYELRRGPRGGERVAEVAA